MDAFEKMLLACSPDIHKKWIMSDYAKEKSNKFSNIMAAVKLKFASRSNIGFGLQKNHMKGKYRK